MRAAVCISGELRNFEYQTIFDTYNSFIKNLEDENYEVDVFISAWSHVGVSHNLVRTDPTLDQNASSDLEERLTRTYKKITAYEIEDYNDWMEKHPSVVGIMKIPLKGGGESVTSPPQLYKIYRCNELKKNYESANNFKYDLVIRTRPDLIYLNKIILSDLDKINQINFGVIGSYWPNRVNDIFFYSDSNNMDKLCSSWISLLDDVDHEFENGLDNKDCCRLLYINCIKNSIGVKDLNTRICAVYRGGPLDQFYSNLQMLNGN
jgi:hypothetical protein